MVEAIQYLPRQVANVRNLEQNGVILGFKRTGPAGRLTVLRGTNDMICCCYGCQIRRKPIPREINGVTKEVQHLEPPPKYPPKLPTLDQIRLQRQGGNR